MAQQLAALANYIAYTIVEGDYYNDWITHLHPVTATIIEAVLILAQPHL